MLAAGTILLLGLAILAGGVASVAGFGIGSLLTPAVALSLGTQAAVAVVAVPHAIATSVRLFGLRSAVDRRVLVTFGVASAAGGLVGAVLHGMFADPILTAALGVLLVLSGALELTGRGATIPMHGPWAWVAGVASGVFGGLVGNQGGIRSAALLRFGLSREALVATATATALLVDAARIPVYALTSAEVLGDNASLVLVLAVGVVVGTLVGVPVLKRLPERVFRRVLATLLLLLGASLLLTAALDARPGQ